MQDGGSREELATAWCVDYLRFPALVRRRSGQGLEVENADGAVLSALCDVCGVENHRRRGTDISVARLEIRGICRRVVREDCGRRGIELHESISPIRRTVPYPVARRDIDVATRVDERAGSAPDRGAALRTRRGVHQPSAVAA